MAEHLQLFLDNGFILGMPILVFYTILLRRSFRLFRDSRNNLYVVGGGFAFSLIVTHLVGSLGSQSFYFYPSSVSLCCAVGVALRLYQKRESITINNGDHASLELIEEKQKKRY